MSDKVNHPEHYTAGGVECIDALKSATTGLEGIEAICTANAIKYLWRWKRKNGIEDLCKASWYINRLIKEIEPEVWEQVFGDKKETEEKASEPARVDNGSVDDFRPEPGETPPQHIDTGWKWPTKKKY